MLIVAVVAAIIAILVLRLGRARRMRAITMRHRALDASGVVIGGGAFTLESPGRPAVLLLHGGGDTPQTMRYLGDALHTRGFHVHAPLLPGHGRSLRAFAHITADQLTDAACRSYEELRAAHPVVAIAGLSMGGALAVQVAVAHPDVPALVLLAPYLAMPRRVERAARWAWLWGPFLAAVRSGDDASIRDPRERERGLAYGVFTPAALRALRATVRRANAVLDQVQSPTLVVHSRGDNRISVADAERTFERLGAREKRLQWTTGAGHVITVDYGRDAVISATIDWIERWVKS